MLNWEEDNDFIIRVSQSPNNERELNGSFEMKLRVCESFKTIEVLSSRENKITYDILNRGINGQITYDLHLKEKLNRNLNNWLKNILEIKMNEKEGGTPQERDMTHEIGSNA